MDSVRGALKRERSAAYAVWTTLHLSAAEPRVALLNGGLSRVGQQVQGPIPGGRVSIPLSNIAQTLLELGNPGFQRFDVSCEIT